MYAQYVFLRVLSALLKQGVISTEKRNNMVALWKEDVKGHASLLEELYSYTENSVWREDLRKAIETC